MQERLKELEGAALSEIASAGNAEALEAARIKYLGRKGLIPDILRKMDEVPPEEKPAVGRLINEIKSRVTNALDERLKFLSSLPALDADITVDLDGAGRIRTELPPLTKPAAGGGRLEWRGLNGEITFDREWKRFKTEIHSCAQR